MKLVSTIARYLLGLIFTVIGLNGFLHFIPMTPMPPAGRPVHGCACGLSLYGPGFLAPDCLRTPFSHQPLCAAGAHVDWSRHRQHPSRPRVDESQRHCARCHRNRLLVGRLLQRPPRLRWHSPASSSGTRKMNRHAPMLIAKDFQ